MTVFPPDRRRIINPNNAFPFPAVAAVDVRVLNTPVNVANIWNFGSGITISPYHVLTAAHVVYDDRNFNQDNIAYPTVEIRATTSTEQLNLHSRLVGNSVDNNAGRGQNVTFRTFFTDESGTDYRQFRRRNVDYDIALLKTDENRPLDKIPRLSGLRLVQTLKLRKMKPLA